MSAEDPRNMATDLAALLHEKLGIRRGETVAQKLPLARTLLPRSVHRAARQVADAARLSGHPRLMKQVDAQAVQAAYKLAAGHLRRLDPKERRKGILLGAAVGLAVNLLILVLGILWLAMVLPLDAA